MSSSEQYDLSAATPTAVGASNWNLLNLMVAAAEHSTFAGKTIFLNLDGECFVDWLHYFPAYCLAQCSRHHDDCHAQGVGAQTTDPVSTFSECVYTQQQPMVRRRMLSETSYSDFISLKDP